MPDVGRTSQWDLGEGQFRRWSRTPVPCPSAKVLTPYRFAEPRVLSASPKPSSNPEGAETKVLKLPPPAPHTP